MPCRVDPIYVDRTATNQDILECLDTLTHGLDVLREQALAGGMMSIMHMRELLLAYEKGKKLLEVQDHEPVTGVKLNKDAQNRLELLVGELTHYIMFGIQPDDLADIEARQTEHRREDMRRLLHHFVDTDDPRISTVLAADPHKPLAPQLGFDPHDI